MRKPSQATNTEQAAKQQLTHEWARAMHVYVFHGSGWWGFTRDPSASNLPPDKGPWAPDTSVLYVLKDYPFDRPLVDEAEMLSAIKSQEYYLTNDAEVARKLKELMGK